MTIIFKQEIPEAAISTEQVDRVYLEDMLEENGAHDLIPVLSSFASGQILEAQGKYMDAAKLYQATLKNNPDNAWIKHANQRVKNTLN